MKEYFLITPNGEGGLSVAHFSRSEIQKLFEYDETEEIFTFREHGAEGFLTATEVEKIDWYNYSNYGKKGIIVKGVVITPKVVKVVTKMEIE